jgi:Tol biopolymer transport system component
MSADGGHQVNVTRHPGVDEFGVWSPDGRQIAFASDRDSTDENPSNYEIYTMRVDGANQVNRTNNPAFDFYPDWQPVVGHGRNGADR